MASDLCEKILEFIVCNEGIDTLNLAESLGTDHQKIVGAVKSLQSLGELIEVKPLVHKKWELTEEGMMVAENGSHEAIVYYAVPPQGILQAELINGVSNVKIGFSKAMSHGWIKMTKVGNDSLVTRKMDSITDIVQQHLKLILANRLDEVTDEYRQEYRKRKLLHEVVIKSYILKKGKNFMTTIEKGETDLTADMVSSHSWKLKNFKPYNLETLGVAPNCGHLHPLLRVRAEFRKIFLEMGFTEMPTNNYVENSFWNFDALFQPQQHPARDAHDTFFVSKPRVSCHFPPVYLEQVKQVHSKGGYGSQGYSYDWKLEEAEKNLLRTHTTAVSARMLYLLAREGFKPSKYFSIDRVFRNETLDATHLAEFHQVEGVIADYNLTLGDLIGTLYEFFKKLGITQLQFKPAYNPYTEPSMEIFCYHIGLGKWIEVGNSGVFRPEMLLPMGLPPDVNVIAWGLSLERPTMIKYGLNNIRDLVGAKVNLRMVYDSPLCRLDKIGSLETDPLKSLEHRWDCILSKLESLQVEIHNLMNTSKCLDTNVQEVNNKDVEFVILADPRYPPYSVVVLLKLLAKHYRINASIHVQSSLMSCSSELYSFFNDIQVGHCEGKTLNIKLIWNKLEKDPLLVHCPISNGTIAGEVNIARYLNRLLEYTPDCSLKYESSGEVSSCQIDECLDLIHSSLIHSSNKECSRALQSLDNVFNKQKWLVGNSSSVADICLWSFLKQRSCSVDLSLKQKKWFDKCQDVWFS